MDGSVDVQANGQKQLLIVPAHTSDSPATGCTPCEEFSLEPVSHETVIEYFQTLPVKKATGCDNMPARLVNEAAQVIGSSITKIINHSILTGSVPTQWKQARISPVFKGGDIVSSPDPTLSRGETVW